MIKALKDTTAQGVQNAITEARHDLGAATGLVFTLLVVVTDLFDYHSVLENCQDAGREHPSRIILVTEGNAKASRLDAEVHLGEDSPGEIIVLRFHGELVEHRDSVILPLLLPDAPVIAWWPGESPASVADDPIGKLASRRITDVAATDDPMESLAIRAKNLAKGDTDLAWTRLTAWRALLASALDRFHDPITSATVVSAIDNTAGSLLAAWLDDKLGCPVIEQHSDDGPGITSVTLTSAAGEIQITRNDGRMASFSAPGTPKRAVALRRRVPSQLLSEDLRRLDNDEVQQAAMAKLVQRLEGAEA